ncbi:N-glycosylase/DNA lyase [Candidatus Woesearchaeota archaeon]|nr:N-glycosylase/DNA lyase [Candidatus Woesearchaeota archaeon]
MGLQGEIMNLKNSSIQITVDSRIKEFKAFQYRPSHAWFTELCFCILTANSTAERCIDVHTKVGNGFLSLPEKQLQKKLRQHSCRFHTKRAGYIAEARKHKGSLKTTLRSFNSSSEAREWLAKNIKGIGYKEASHFLRNTGYDDVAIIDFHIIDIMADNGMIARPKTLNKKVYDDIEQSLKMLADKTGLTLAELDLYLWYMETGKILK